MKIWNRISPHIYVAGVVVVTSAAGYFNNIVYAMVGVVLAYIAGLTYGEGQNHCAECGESFTETDDDDEIPGRKTGFPSFEELRNAMKPKGRQNSEHKPGNHEPVSAESKWYAEPNRSRLADATDDIPRSRRGTNYAVQADGTVETPHDRMYRPEGVATTYDAD